MGEFDCRTLATKRICVQRRKTCDKEDDCGNNSDELESYGTICGMCS